MPVVQKYIGALVISLSASLLMLGALMPVSGVEWLDRSVPGYAVATGWLKHMSPSMKLLHVMAYAWLALLWLFLRRPKQRTWQLACALLGFGILAECLQVFSVGREARLGDVIANAVGIGVGLGMGFITVRVLGTLRLRRAAGRTAQKRD